MLIDIADSVGSSLRPHPRYLIAVSFGAPLLMLAVLGSSAEYVSDGWYPTLYAGVFLIAWVTCNHRSALIASVWFGGTTIRPNWQRVPLAGFWLLFSITSLIVPPIIWFL